MNQHAKIETAVPTGISAEEWQARTDLAAVYRLCAHYGWDDLIYNHCSMRVPGEPSKFLMKQHELLWTEVTASNLRKVDMNDDLDEKVGRQPAGLHPARRRAQGPRRRQLRGARPHRDRHGAGGPQARPAHGVAAGACASISASAITPTRASPRISASASASSRRSASNRALVLQNHGLLTVGKNAREAFILMKYLMSAATIQLKMEATGGEADRNSRRGLREGGGAVPDPRRRPRLGRLAGLSADDGSARSGLPELGRSAHGCGRNVRGRAELCRLGGHRRAALTLPIQLSAAAASIAASLARRHNGPQERALDVSNKGWSIRHRLMLLALAVALPFVLLTGGIVWQLANNERETRREAILFRPAR